MKKSLSTLLVIMILISLTACKTKVNSQAQSEDDPIWGKKNAPITMVIFSDFECPYCAEYSETTERLKEDWIDTGKLKIQYRDYPLASHLNSLSAHVTANAAGKQGKYMEMHQLLFGDPERWSFSLDPDQTFLEMALEIGLDESTFVKDYNDELLLDEIREDRDKGRELGVAGTPATFINDEIYQGALSYEDLVGELEKMQESL